MPRGTKSTASGNKLEEIKKEYGSLFNTVVIRGKIVRVVVDSNKVKKYSVGVPSETTKGNVVYAYITVTEFVEDSEAYTVDTIIHVEGRLTTGSYERNGSKNYTTEIVASRIEEVWGVSLPEGISDEIPFN